MATGGSEAAAPAREEIAGALGRAMEGAEGELARLGGGEFEFLGAGSTALGIEAVLRDRRRFPDRRLWQAASHAGGRGAPTRVGISFSARSAEVVDRLRATGGGPRAVLITGQTAAATGVEQIRLATGAVPRRFLPLLAALVVVLATGGDWRAALVRWCAAGPRFVAGPSFLEALVRAHRERRIPLFVGDGEEYLARVLARQYMEFMKAPAFDLRYPEFTHDLLWTLGASGGERFECFRVGWTAEPSDARGHRTRRYLVERGLLCPEVALAPEATSDPHATCLLQVLHLYAALAPVCGVDADAELTW